MKSYVPPENPTKPWPTQAPMERWFLYQRREPTGSKIASRRGSKPTFSLARGPLPCVEADAGSQDSWRTGEFSLAFLPYGNSQLHLFHRVSQDLSKGIAGTVTCCKPLIPSNQALYSGELTSE